MRSSCSTRRDYAAGNATARVHVARHVRFWPARLVQLLRARRARAHGAVRIRRPRAGHSHDRGFADRLDPATRASPRGARREDRRRRASPSARSFDRRARCAPRRITRHAFDRCGQARVAAAAAQCYHDEHAALRHAARELLRDRQWPARARRTLRAHGGRAHARRAATCRRERRPRVLQLERSSAAIQGQGTRSIRQVHRRTRRRCAQPRSTHVPRRDRRRSRFDAAAQPRGDGSRRRRVRGSAGRALSSNRFDVADADAAALVEDHRPSVARGLAVSVLRSPSRHHEGAGALPVRRLTRAAAVGR